MLVGAREDNLENGFRLRQLICCSVSSGKQLKVKRTSTDADYTIKLCHESTVIMRSLFINTFFLSSALCLRLSRSLQTLSSDSIVLIRSFRLPSSLLIFPSSCCTFSKSCCSRSVSSQITKFCLVLGQSQKNQLETPSVSMLLTCGQSSGSALRLDHLCLFTDQHILHVPQLTVCHCIHVTQSYHVLNTQNIQSYFSSTFLLCLLLPCLLFLLTLLHSSRREMMFSSVWVIASCS